MPGGASNVGPKYRCPVFSKVEMSGFPSEFVYVAAEARGLGGAPDRA
jgi:hypothetical protein